MIKAIKILVERFFKNKKFVEAPPFSLRKAFDMTAPHIPIIFILSTGADPLAEIIKFSKELNKTDEDYHKLSLGKGQEKVADSFIKSTRKNGQWIILQNCHMCPSFLPILESKVVETTNLTKGAKKKDSKKEEEDEAEADDEVDEDKKVNKNFRFWITTMPDERFPT